MTGDPLHPAPTLLVKLGSIAVHAQEAAGPLGHPLDLEAMKPLLADPEVAAWLDEMGRLALIPLRRTRNR